MFLKKITGIKLVGRFRIGGVSGGEYAKHTLFYGGNGRGKTTMCAILRSLQLNNPGPIVKRRTFQATGVQEVQLLLDTGPIKFSAGAWSSQQPDLHIFDQTFIAEHVHSGDQIEVGHRRNFYRVVVGPQGIALAVAIDTLDSEVTNLQTQITNEKKVLQQHVPAGMTLEKFLKLALDPDIDTKIDAAALALKAIENAAEIGLKAKFVAVSLPALPSDFSALIAKGMTGVAADAASRVQAQITKHGFHETGEAWLAEGFAHLAGEACPFCSASIVGNALLEAYQGYFSEAYAAHKTDLDGLLARTEAALGQATALKANQSFIENSRLGEFWSQYAKHGFIVPNGADRVIEEVNALHQTAVSLLKAKIAAPLESPIVPEGFDAAAHAWAITAAELAVSNASMASANLIIQGVKDANARADKATAQTTLANLHARKARHTDPFLSLFIAYDALIKKKEAAVADKEAKKDELDLYDAAVFGEYENDINTVLKTFDAGFRLAKCGKSYVGKIPQSAYCLHFDGHNLDITANPGDTDPSFGSTMSAGDKNTFALAFFLTQLARDPDIGNKIVVFDDPFTSLDDFRREMTAKAIVRMGEKAAQILVFSHDKYFLNSIKEKLHGAPCAAMQLSVTHGNSAIEPWDIEWEVKEGYLQDHMRLADFANGVTNEAAASRTLMRPLLEKYIRYRFPNQIQPGHWLGDMLAVIRADATHPLTPQYNEIDDINEYTAPFHHDPNKSFNADEVLAHVKRTLAVVGGC